MTYLGKVGTRSEHECLRYQFLGLDNRSNLISQTSRISLIIIVATAIPLIFAMGKLKLALLHGINKVRAMNTPIEFQLLDLPNEIISLIISHVKTVSLLKLLCRTCRRVQHLAEPYLYRYALIRTGTETEMVLNAMLRKERKKDRVAALQAVDIPCNPKHHQNFRAVEQLLNEAVSLKELMVESPECNNMDFESEAEWEEMVGHLFRPFQAALTDTASPKPLQNLRRFVLHMNGSHSPYWTMDSRSLTIFLLPSLTHLKMSCVNLPQQFPGGTHERAKSSLKCLEMEECNITHQGLHYILGLPRALEVLYLGENCHNFRHFGDHIDPVSNHLFSADSTAALAALGQQSHSLRDLTYAATDMHYQHQQCRLTARNSTPTDAGFVDFGNLESVTLIGICPTFERAVMSSRSPPSLKSLTYRCENIFQPLPNGISETPFAAIPFLRAPSSSVPSTLAKIDVICDNIPLTPATLSTQTRDYIRTAARETSKAGIHLRVFTQGATTYYPPYLFREPRPLDHLVYDAELSEDFFPIPSHTPRVVHLWGPIEE